MTARMLKAVRWEPGTLDRPLRTIAVFEDESVASFLSFAGEDPRVAALALCYLVNVLDTHPSSFTDLLIGFTPTITIPL